MAYTEKNMAVLTQLGTAAASAITSTGVPANSINYLGFTNFRISNIYFKVTTAMSSSGAAVLHIYARPTFGSSSGQISVGTLTIPAAAVADQVYYKDITPVNCLAGYQIVLNVDTASTSAGAGIWGMQTDLDPETEVNQTVMIASA